MLEFFEGNGLELFGQRHLPLAGGTMLGAIDLGGFLPTNLNAQILPQLSLLNRVVCIPTNVAWPSTKVNGGDIAVDPGYIDCYSSNTPNSAVSAYVQICGLNAVGETATTINWDKPLYLFVDYFRSIANAQGVAYVSLGEETTGNSLTHKGIGIVIENLAVSSDSYGVGHGGASLTTTLGDAKGVGICIFHDPRVPSITWYVNGVAKYIETTAANIPSGNSTGTVYLRNRVYNGANATDCKSILSNIRILQIR